MVAVHNKPLVLDRSLNHFRLQGEKGEVVFLEEPYDESPQPSREYSNTVSRELGGTMGKLCGVFCSFYYTDNSNCYVIASNH